MLLGNAQTLKKITGGASIKPIQSSMSAGAKADSATSTTDVSGSDSIKQ